MRKTPKLNKRKARNVILYLLSSCRKMTKKKLIHLLYFLDMDFFEKYEYPFVGFTYQKTPSGIKCLELDNILKEIK